MPTAITTSEAALKLQPAAEYVCASRLLFFYRPTTPQSTWYAFERMRYFVLSHPPEKQDDVWEALFGAIKIDFEVARILSALPAWRQPAIRALVDRQPWCQVSAACAQ